MNSLSPATVTVGGAAFTLTVTGTGIDGASVVQWNGSPRTTALVSATQLTAAITAADIATTGNVTVTVAGQTATFSVTRRWVDADQLPVAKKRSEHRWGNGDDEHDARNRRRPTAVRCLPLR